MGERISFQAFLNIAKTTDENLELINGQIIKIAAATPKKAMIVGNVSYLIGGQLPEHAFCFCNMVFKFDDENCPHADILIVENDSINGEFLENPTVLGKIITNLNNKENLTTYQTYPSVQEILLIEQNRPNVILYQKNQQLAWNCREFGLGETVCLDSVGAILAVDDIYRQVKF